MRFGYTIAYVPDVQAALDFYAAAFGLPGRLLAPDASYGEVDTGSTTLGFAAVGNAPCDVRLPSPDGPPLGIELAFVTDDVPAALTVAVAAGATLVAEAKVKPWGQTVGYVRDPSGILVELCTPVG